MGMSMNKANTERSWGITTCVAAVDLLNIISSLGWAAQFFAAIASACPVESSPGADCAGLVCDFVATVASWAPLMDAIPKDCDSKAIGKDAGISERDGDQ